MFELSATGFIISLAFLLPILALAIAIGREDGRPVRVKTPAEEEE